MPIRRPNVISTAPGTSRINSTTSISSNSGGATGTARHGTSSANIRSILGIPVLVVPVVLPVAPVLLKQLVLQYY